MRCEGTLTCASQRHADKRQPYNLFSLRDPVTRLLPHLFWRRNNSVTCFVTRNIMKTTKLLLCAAVALLGPVVLQAAKTPKGPVRAEVNFFEPSKFTDLKDNAMENDKERGR